MISLLALFLTITPRAQWVLEYHCEYSLPSDVCETEEASEKRPFKSKQEAIDWVETNYIYYPSSLAQGDKALPCKVAYLSEDDPDPITVLRKEVTCGKH